MQRESYDQLYKVEDDFWYHESLRRLVGIYLGRIRAESSRALKILDVGSGTGGMFDLLSQYAEVGGLEISDYAVSLCSVKHPLIKVKTGSANNLDKLFCPHSFDVVTFFNVLYHQWVINDYDVLRQAVGLLRDGGYIIVNEPAFRCLYRNSDKLYYGLRRYSLSEIKGMFSRLGLEIKVGTYLNFVSFLPLLILSLVHRMGFIKLNGAPNELKPLPAPVNELLKRIMALERIWITHFGRMPLGASLLVIGRKRT